MSATVKGAAILVVALISCHWLTAGQDEIINPTPAYSNTTTVETP